MGKTKSWRELENKQQKEVYSTEKVLLSEMSGINLAWLLIDRSLRGERAGRVQWHRKLLWAPDESEGRAEEGG